MNYQKVYNQIIEKAKSENRKKLKRDNPDYVYYERHHILPKSMGGNNKKENLVLLTGREHFICHKLLIRFTEGANKRSMLFALHKMIFSKNIKNDVDSAKEYECIREEHSKAVSENNKIRVVSPETGRKISQSKIGLDIYTDELREIRSKQMSGEGNNMYGVHRAKEDVPFYGHTHTKENLKILSEKAKNREKLECPHCGKISDISNAKRWHFDNCKHNPNISQEALDKKAETCEKLRQHNLGRKDSEEVCKKKSEAMKGDKNHFYKKIHSEESLNKIKKAANSRKKKTCPYCNKEFYPGNYAISHGEKCKHKPK